MITAIMNVKKHFAIKLTKESLAKSQPVMAHGPFMEMKSIGHSGKSHHKGEVFHSIYPHMVRALNRIV
jgi:hypothetical protein